MGQPGTDQGWVRAQYADSTNLTARASLYQWQVPKVDLHERVLSSVDWPTSARVLDVGCGPGAYLRRLAGKGRQLVGVDLSPGMAAEAAASGAATLSADAAHLPFEDGTFDRVLACHMLYHCPDVEATVAELRRVLRPGGVLVVVLNGQRHLAHFLAQRSAAAQRKINFAGANAMVAQGRELLPHHFASVEVELLAAEVAVDSLAPVVAYFDSARNLVEPQLASNRPWDTTRTAFADLVQADLARDGVWRTTIETGILVCR